VLAAERAASGAIHVAGRLIGIPSPGPVGPVWLAVWGPGIRLTPDHGAGIEGTVTGARLAPGRWEVSADIGQPLVAHLPLGDAPPRPGTRIHITIEPSFAVVIDDVPPTT
jgi:hypothetical protein